MLPTRRRALGALASGLFASTAYGQKNPPDIVAGIPVNYDEARVGTYSYRRPGSRSCKRSVMLCTPADTGPFRQTGMCI
jgi:hypothetical protein